MIDSSIYILYSEKSDIFYIDQTDNVENRVIQHNDPNNKSFTSKHQPWILKSSFITGTDRGIAMKIERFIKKQKSKIFIRKLIENPFQFDFIAQLVRVPRCRD